MMNDIKRELVIEKDSKLAEKLKEAFKNSEPGKVSVVEPKELKHKKGIPTVIEYQGRRYVLDHANNRK
jgi:hypothetical protein